MIARPTREAVSMPRWTLRMLTVLVAVAGLSWSSGCTRAEVKNAPSRAVPPAADPAEGCESLSSSIRLAAEEAGACEQDSDCVLLPVDICAMEGLGCYWAAVNTSRPTGELTSAIDRYLTSDCIQADCDCNGPPETFACLQGQCAPAEPRGAQ